MSRCTCPLCGGERADYIFTEKSYKLMSCRTCDLFYIDPYTSEDDAHAKVRDYDYDDHDIISADGHYRSALSFYKIYYPLLKKEYDEAQSALDVGCGTGRLLELLGNDFDMERMGIEFNNARAEFANKVANCEIVQTPIEKFSSDQKFDVISLINVLSHISSFDSLFNSIRGLLNKNGKFILKVGEMTTDVRKDACFDWEIPDHLHFLGMNTIDFICKKYKFKVLRHDRQLLADELFSRERWKAPGRSAARNMVKAVLVRTPFALQFFKWRYQKKHGENLFSSLIVLTPTDQT